MTRSLLCPTCKLRHFPRCDNGNRWPLAPLIDCIGERGVKALAALLGTSGDTIANAAAHGLTDVLADRWAVRLGLHPGCVWSDWFDAGLTTVDRQFVESGWRQAWEHTEAMTAPATEEQAA